jgi:hypothetical protein
MRDPFLSNLDVGGGVRIALASRVEREIGMTMRVILWVMLFATVMSSSPGRSEAACTPAPATGCRFVTGRHQNWILYYETRATDPDDVFTWAWRGGKDTQISDFGNPATTGYSFCIYDASDRTQPVVGISPTQDASQWHKLDDGFLYRVFGDQKLRKLMLRAELNGRGKILAHGDSTTVNHILPFVTPVVVQVQEDNGTCWESDFANPMRNDKHVFRVE